jgi:fibrillarin-like pre-rRNA processing protein
MKQIQPGIYQNGEKIFTENANPGEQVYGENLIEVEGIEYREWNPYRSKVGAAVKKNIDLEVEADSDILYLGAASGTTVSHFSDILTEGFIVGVEYSEKVARKLVKLSERRDNIAPIVADARKTEEYSDYIDEVDVVFQDISQRDQPEIFLKNCREFLRDDGVALIAVKARSISTSEDVNEIFTEVKQKLSQELEIVSETRLAPFEKEHLFLKLVKH